MSLKVLELGNLSLINPNDNLKLSITTAMDIRVPENLSSLEPDTIVKALTSGKIWASRGTSCHLAARLFIDGKPLDDMMRLYLLENLGSYLRGLKLWSLLSLSTTLEVLQTRQLDESPDIALDIYHGLQIAKDDDRQTKHGRGSNTDTRPPASVLCARLERLQINFDFHPIEAQAPCIIIPEYGPGSDIMLLDIPPEVCGDNCSKGLESPVGIWHEPPKSLQNRSDFRRVFEPEVPIIKPTDQTPFEPVEAPGRITEQDVQHFPKDENNETCSRAGGNIERSTKTFGEAKHYMSQLTGVVELESVVESLQTLPQLIEDCFGFTKDVESGNGPTKPPKRRKFSREITDTLVVWFESNASKYPTREEKMRVMAQTGSQKSQLNSWIKYRRNKQSRAPNPEHNKMLFSPSQDRIADEESNKDSPLSQKSSLTYEFTEENDQAPPVIKFHYFINDDMLLSMPMQHTPASLQSDGPRNLGMDFEKTSGHGNLSSESTEYTHRTPVVSDGSYNQRIDEEHHEDNDDMLFFLPTVDIPSSLASQPTTFSDFSISQSDYTMSDLQGTPTPNTVLSNLSVVCKLAALGLHAILCGYDSRSSRGSPQIIVENPRPEVTVENLVPTLFSPGFKDSVALNASFIPKLSHTISTSWPKNVQSPNLKRKLLQLATLSPSLTKGVQGSEENETNQRLSAVVQSRLWEVMRKKLYDPAIARKLWKQGEIRPATIEEEEDFEDLIDTECERDGGEDEDLLGDLADDDEFNDLLADEEDGLLGYLEDSERERLAVEQETDEMLFGNEWNETISEEDVLLLETDGGAEDSILLE